MPFCLRDECLQRQPDQFFRLGSVFSRYPLQGFGLSGGYLQLLRIHSNTVSYNYMQDARVILHYNALQMISPTLTIRVSDEQIAELRDIAKKNGVNVSQLVRWSVEALIRQVDRNKGRLVLPVDFSGEKKRQ